MAGQGVVRTEQEIQKIVALLSATDMTIGEIAQRMNCSKSVVVTVNRKFRVRDYAGLRSSWTLHKKTECI